MSCDRISSPDISFPLNSRDSECEKVRDNLAVSIREIRTELDKNRTFRYDARLVTILDVFGKISFKHCCPNHELPMIVFQANDGL